MRTKRNVGRDGQEIVYRVEVADLIVEHRRDRDDHDELRELRRLDADWADRDPALGAKSRLSDKHDGHEQDQVEDVELVAVPFEDLVVKIHEEGRQCDVHERKDALTLDKPVAFLTRCIDVRRTADDDEAHDDDGRRRSNEDVIRPAQITFVHHSVRLLTSSPHHASCG